MAEMVKDDIDAGRINDWGISAGSGAGYAIVEGTEDDVWEMCVKYRPYIFFKGTPSFPSINIWIQLGKWLHK